VAASGGRSQVPGIVAAATIVILLVAAASLLADLPQATLGAVLIYVALRIFRVHDLAAILRFDRGEFGVAMVTLAVVVVLGVGPGILLAVLLAILDRTWRSAHPHDAVLGRVPGTTVWWSLKERPDGEILAGVVCYRFDAALYFANATRFRDRVREVVAAAAPPPRLFVLDASGVEDLDFTGGRILLQVVHELHQGGIDFAVARATGQTPRDAAHAGLRKHIGDDHMFLTVDEAVRTLGLSEARSDGPQAGEPGATTGSSDEAPAPAAAPPSQSSSTTSGGQP
jgi:MFS superfamily sulfate permease-like transporter